MAFRVSPGVTVQERDFTTIVPDIATTPAAFVGAFPWGRVEERTLVETENVLKSNFGKPDDDTFTHWFSVSNYLAYGNFCYVVRVVGDLAKNAVAEETAVLVKNEDHYNETFVSSGEVMMAKYPGALGNSIGVIMLDSGNYTNATYDIDNDGVLEDIEGQFEGAPSTSSYTSNRGGSNDEMHILIYDRLGLWTGFKGEVLERHSFVSKASDAKRSDGTSAYYKDVLNNESKYVWWASHPADPANTGDSGMSNWGNASTNTSFATFATDTLNPGDAVYEFTGGVDDNGSASITTAKKQTGADLFIDGNVVDVGLFIAGPGNATYINYLTQNIAEIRKDCVIFGSPERSTVVNNAGSEHTDLVAWRNELTSSSYLFLDSAWKYQYDRYNSVYRYAPLGGDMAGLAARADLTNDPWWSFGGFNRGIIKNTVKLSWTPSEAKMGVLYRNSINPIVMQSGFGPVLMGDKTALSKPSAFDRINVRRLFIVMEKSVATAAKFQLFEFNDDFTRAQFKGIVEPFLRDVMGRRGITDFRVVCDNSNNTPQVISNNEFVADIFVKPNYSINYVLLRFNAVGPNVSFEEVGG